MDHYRRNNDGDRYKSRSKRDRPSSSPDNRKESSLRELKEKARRERHYHHRDRNRGQDNNHRQARLSDRKLDDKSRNPSRSRSPHYHRRSFESNTRNERERSDSFRMNHRRHDDDEFERKKNNDQTENEEKLPEIRPNFELTGALARDTNTFNGIVIKYNQPPEAKKPTKHWRLYPFKGSEALDHINIHNQSAYLFGRERRVADIPIDHPSCSKQHAVIQFRSISVERLDGTTRKVTRPYIIDLDSANGTYVNFKKLEPSRYVELFEKDVIKFGFSSREYVLLHSQSQADDDHDDDDNNN
ncbi:Smad nuclear-interacting protein 1 [Dermatophagoides farinae]|uniref:Smad nuclear-interacting protein 1 n=1 Tax=Dermatophagoides farinae TaxID=6954 RepID=A0A922I390_DERFA|nr:Smad nuclear-interacting protein 1 [Dermatophagoides farinae]